MKGKDDFRSQRDFFLQKFSQQKAISSTWQHVYWCGLFSNGYGLMF